MSGYSHFRYKWWRWVSEIPGEYRSTFCKLWQNNVRTCWVVCNSKIVHARSFQIKGVVLIYGILHDMIWFKLKYVHDVSRLHKHNGCRPRSRRRLTFWTKLSPFVFYDRSFSLCNFLDHLIYYFTLVSYFRITHRLMCTCIQWIFYHIFVI